MTDEELFKKLSEIADEEIMARNPKSIIDVGRDIIAASIADTAGATPVAWLHTMHMEGGQTDERLSFSDENPWGKPGFDYSEEYAVVSKPLVHPAPVAREWRLTAEINGEQWGVRYVIDEQSTLGQSLKHIERQDAEIAALRERIAGMEKDAERYRWLRNEHFPTADKPPLAQVVWKKMDNRHGSQWWANLIDGNDLDRAIDDAISKEK